MDKNIEQILVVPAKFRGEISTMLEKTYSNLVLSKTKGLQLGTTEKNNNALKNENDTHCLFNTHGRTTICVRKFI